MRRNAGNRRTEPAHRRLFRRLSRGGSRRHGLRRRTAVHKGLKIPENAGSTSLPSAWRCDFLTSPPAKLANLPRKRTENPTDVAIFPFQLSFRAVPPEGSHPVPLIQPERTRTFSRRRSAVPVSQLTPRQPPRENAASRERVKPVAARIRPPRRRSPRCRELRTGEACGSGPCRPVQSSLPGSGFLRARPSATRFISASVIGARGCRTPSGRLG